MSRARTPLRGWLWGLAAFCLLALAASPGWCGERGVVLTSLEWPPYCSASLPGGGITTRVVRAAFQEAGYRVEVRFLPWQRAVEQARENPGVAAVFPEYGSGRPDIDFLTSDVIGLSTLGLVEVVDRPVDWRTLDDLSRYRLGTVKGYLNTDAFDRMAVRGAFEIDSSVSDLLNLRKVMVGRVDLAVADVNVFRYLGQADRPCAGSGTGCASMRACWGSTPCTSFFAGGPKASGCCAISTEDSGVSTWRRCSSGIWMRFSPAASDWGRVKKEGSAPRCGALCRFRFRPAYRK